LTTVGNLLRSVGHKWPHPVKDWIRQNNSRPRAIQKHGLVNAVVAGTGTLPDYILACTLKNLFL